MFMFMFLSFLQRSAIYHTDFIKTFAILLLAMKFLLYLKSIMLKIDRTSLRNCSHIRKFYGIPTLSKTCGWLSHFMELCVQSDMMVSQCVLLVAIFNAKNDFMFDDCGFFLYFQLF